MKKTSTEKINEILGISSIDDFLSDLSVDDGQSFSDIDLSVKNEIISLDNSISSFQNGNLSEINLNNIEESFLNLRDLIDNSKSILKHVHENIITTDLCDSELIQAYSKLLESAHLTIAEYIQLYKDRIAFYDKIKLMNLKQQQDLEKMKIKHQYDLELIEKRNTSGAIDVQDEEYSFSFENAIKEMNLN